VPDVTHADAAAREFVMCRLYIGDGQAASAEPGAAVVSPKPNVTEVPERGGVNWTMRSPSSGATSSSSLQPKSS